MTSALLNVSFKAFRPSIANSFSQHSPASPNSTERCNSRWNNRMRSDEKVE
ncbi:unnamed protein product [Mycena citricolor]|uniref:Uncharacterized protein n=1 Tax=Mycena citricolor TaxID=2018698 RepID=A0AAD2HG42_9AGAR|nr:unnamed protein product [Mycena citricolor]